MKALLRYNSVHASDGLHSKKRRIYRGRFRCCNPGSQATLKASQAEVTALKQQLDWFKRQLFGRTSERRILQNPDQLDLSVLLGDTPPPVDPEPTEEITCRRRKPRQRSEDDVTDSGLRFGPEVPVEVIKLPAPQLEGPEADQYEVIDTNHLERALRVIPMGRKNWLFCWNEAGARQVGIIQSLLTTCRLHDVDPYTYLVDVLQRVALHPARDVIELTPHIWKARFADTPLRSDLDHAH